KIPPKVKLFIWRVGRDNLPTKTTLQQKRVFIALGCGICGGGVESPWHIFLDCPFARECWSKAGIIQEVA
ncbi:hypothetical protein LINPERHAP2_LOCUS18833, partial [Linum perenne]